MIVECKKNVDQDALSEMFSRDADKDEFLKEFKEKHSTTMTINKELLELKKKLQLKKNEVRTELAKKGTLKRGGYNMGQKFFYFTEAQYKVLFNRLFSKYGLEFSASISDVNFSKHESSFGKSQNGCVVTMKASLYDISTGYHEESSWPGIGYDIGDKALYKAFTGAVKSYLNNTFLVASDNDPDRDQVQTTKPITTTKPTYTTRPNYSKKEGELR